MVPPSSNSLRTSLWPPNHELHTFTAEECAGANDVCDAAPDVRFSSASSDEPVNAKGDGSHTPDMVFDSASTVSLRAERQGPDAVAGASHSHRCGRTDLRIAPKGSESNFGIAPNGGVVGNRALFRGRTTV